MKPDKNNELMRLCGSKTGQYDPEAPGQWQWVMGNSKDAHERAMAWVKSKTTAWHHESPFCVDEYGKPVYVENMAVELGWAPQTARNILAQLATQGRVRLEKGKRIFYRSDVPNAGQNTEINESANNRVHGYWATYVIDFIGELPEAERIPASRTLDAYRRWRQEFFADGMASLRSIADRYEDSTLERVGIPKKRLPKRRPIKTKWVQLSLLAEPESVHGYAGELVQNGDPESAQNQTPPVPSGASFVSSTATPLTTTTPIPTPFVRLDVVVVGNSLRAYGTISDRAVSRFCAECREHSPDCTTDAVVAVIERTGPTLSKNVANKLGVLLTSVPGAIAAHVAEQRDRQAQEPKCWGCSGSIAGGGVNGLCWDCVEKQQRGQGRAAKGASS